MARRVLCRDRRERPLRPSPATSDVVRLVELKCALELDDSPRRARQWLLSLVESGGVQEPCRWAGRISGSDLASQRGTLEGPCLQRAARLHGSVSGLGRRLALGSGLGLLVVVGLMVASDVSALRQTFQTLSWAPFGWALLLSLAGYGLRVIKWELYLRALSIRLPLLPSVLCFFAGMVMSITPGKVGEVLKSFLLRQAYEVPVARSAPIVVAERLTDLMALLLLTSLGVWSSGYGWGVLIAGTLLVLAIMLVFAWDALGRFVIGTCARLPLFAGWLLDSKRRGRR